MIELPPRVLVLGLGRSGRAAARLLADRGCEVWVTDRKTENEMGEELRTLPDETRAFLGGHPEASLEGVGLVVTSPGVRPDLQLLQTARSQGLPVLAEIELGWLHRPEAPLAAITGSNGKSTVTTLVSEILGADGTAVAAGGNLGRPACELVMEGGWDTWVLEVSSFQTELLTAMRPLVGVFLNVSQDHLERHPTLEAYACAKRRLFAHQSAEDVAVLNADDPLVAATRTRSRQARFSLKSGAHASLVDGMLVVDGRPMLPEADLQLAGRHNTANALAAALAASRLGASDDAARTALRTFAGLPHRHRTVAEAGGVRWVNDSKATNIGATIAALSGYAEGSVHLILGGLAKGQDFRTLVPALAPVARVYLIGEDAELIAGALEDHVGVERCATLGAAVRCAGERTAAGQTVLLAPACASFDQFASYAERGETFVAHVHEEVRRCR